MPTGIYKHTKEQYQKLWETRRKNGTDKLSEETKKNMSIAQIKIFKNPERKRKQKESSFIHGLCNSSTYVTWHCMKTRCNDKNNKYYGGRGITYDSKWENFVGFLEDMGIRPKGYVIDRIDPNKNYYKENCRWVDLKTSLQNKRKK